MSIQRDTSCVLALLFRDVNLKTVDTATRTVRFISICLTNLHCTTGRISQAERFTIETKQTQTLLIYNRNQTNTDTPDLQSKPNKHRHS